MNQLAHELCKKEANSYSGELLDKFTRMLQIEGAAPEQREGRYLELQIGQVVHVSFIGQGSVIDGNHFAVVWHSHPGSDHVVVIPLSSSGHPNYCLGLISDLNEQDSYVKVNQIQTISRKSLTAELRTPSGNKCVYLDEQQLQRLVDLFRFTHLKEMNLEKILRFRVGALVPREFPGEYIGELNRPISYFLVGHTLFYQAWDFAECKRLELVDLGLSRRQRKEFLQAMFGQTDVALEK